jgi:hypothetical protein
MKNGVTLIGEERDRQRGAQFGFTDAHDDAHTNGELVDLAEHLLDEADPTDLQQYGRKIVRAAACLAAELDRITRATGGRISFSTTPHGIAQGGPADKDNRDGSQANLHANDPVRTPVGRGDNKDGSLAGGNKPVIDDGTRAATAPNTPPAKVDHATKVAPHKTVAKRATATAKAQARGARPRAKR